MYQEHILSNLPFDEFRDDGVDELVGAISSLYSDGMSRKGISELLNIHVMQVRDLIDVAYNVRLH